MKLIIIGIFSAIHLFIGVDLHYKNKYPQDYFASPVNHELKLSGTFGELRSNHFHSGIDIKPSKGGIGDPIFSAAEGHIVRISVSGGGFGNAIYVQHPNGYTSVYAHLHAFTSDVAAYVKKRQYELKSFSVNLYPGEAFPVAKKQRIGIMGNSGSSTGAHLHFEIRKSSDSKPINPMLFGYKIEDNVNPTVKNIAIYELDKNQQIIKKTLYPINFSEPIDPIHVQSNLIGIGVQTYDMMDNLRNKNGVYKIDLEVNQNPTYAIRFEDFHFSESRYLNAHTDYHHYRTNRQMIHRLYNIPGNKFSLCQFNNQDGIVAISNNESKAIKLSISDYNGNINNVKFKLVGDEIKSRLYTTGQDQVFKYSQSNSINTNNFKLQMPAGCIYEDLPLSYLEVAENSPECYSSSHVIHENKIPIHKYFDIKIKPTKNIPPKLISKAIIAECSNANNYYNCGAKWDGEYLSTKIRSLGSFVVVLDTIAPKITPIKFAKDMSTYKRMSFEIKDDMPTTGRAKGVTYEGYVDGQWILFEYDGKKNRIFHTFDERISKGDHKLSIVAIDDRKNKKYFKSTFKR